MFVTTARYTINTDAITYAEEEDGSTIIHFGNGESISIPTAEARAIFTSLIPRLEWGTSAPQDA